MALKYATKTGLWSDPTVWNGGSLPIGGDTVLTNTFVVTIDQDVDLSANAVSVNAGSFVTNQRYKITTVGNTDFTLVGAIKNMVGVEFLATGAGSGTGVALTVSDLANRAQGAAAAGGYFVVSGARTITAGIDSSSNNTGGGGTQSILVFLDASSSLVLNGSIRCVAATYSGIGLNYSTTLTVNGNVLGPNVGGSSTNKGGITSIAGTGTHVVNINGNLINSIVSVSGGECLYLAAPTTVNIVGDLYPQAPSTYGVIQVKSAAHVINLTGNIYTHTTLTTANAPAVVVDSTAVGTEYNQTGNIYHTYASGILLNTPTKFRLTGNVVGSGAGNSSYYAFDGQTTNTPGDNWIHGDILSGQATSGIKLTGGNLKVVGTARKSDGSTVLFALGATAKATLDLSECLVSYVGNGSTANVISIGAFGGDITLVQDVVQKGTSAFAYWSGTSHPCWITITGNVSNTGSASAVYMSGATNANEYLTINGDVTCAGSGYCISMGHSSGPSTLVITGSVYHTPTTNSVSGIIFAGHKDAVVTIGGNVYGATTGNNNIAINSTASSVGFGQFTIAGNVIGGANATSNTTIAIFDSTSAVAYTNVTVNGDVTAGHPTGSSAIVFSGLNPLSWVKLNGTVSASASQHAVVASATNSASKLGVYGRVNNHVSGYQGVNYRAARYDAGASIGTQDDTGASVILYDSTTWTGEVPLPTDVRAGVTYGVAGAYTGDCVVPSPAAVVQGVPVDHTVGLAIVDFSSMPTPADIAAVVRTELTPELGRVAVCSTLESVGAQLAALT